MAEAAGGRVNGPSGGAQSQVRARRANRKTIGTSMVCGSGTGSGGGRMRTV